MKKKVLILAVLLLATAVLATAVYGLEKRTFYDVPSGHWASEAIEYLAGKGLMGGYPDGSFKPEEKMSRAEVATLLYRVLKLQESEAKLEEKAPAGKTTGLEGMLSEKVKSFRIYGSETVFGADYPGLNPFESLRYFKVTTPEESGIGVKPSRSLLGTEDVELTGVGDKTYSMVLVADGIAYHMSGNGKVYWLTGLEDGADLPERDYLGYYELYGDTLYLIEG